MTAPTLAELDQLGTRILATPRDRFKRWAETLTPAERATVAQAIERAKWTKDPSTFAAHLDPDRFNRWRYVALLGDAFRRAVSGESKRLIIMMPARMGKTLLTSVWGSAWALNSDPSAHIILTSYGHDLALKNSGMVRDILANHADQLAATVRHGRSSVERWETEQGGQVMASGVGGAMTGFGGNTIVVDDPFKNWQEAASQLRRDTVWDWFRSVVYTRLQTADSSIVIVTTRWHEDDLVGRCLAPPDGEKPEDWEVIRLPAIAEAPIEGGKPWEQLPDPLGREPGEVIEPERFPPEAVHDRARVLGTFLSTAMEQQRPSAAEGAMLKRAWWKWYVSRPTVHEVDDWLMSWDASFAAAAGSSYCVGTLWARVGGNKYLIDLVRDRMEYPEFRTAVASFARKWPQCRKILVEDKANGPAVLADLRGHVAGLVARSPKGSKESRVNAIAGDVEAGNVWLPDPAVNDIDVEVDRSFVHAFVDECAAFPTGANDDQVDTTTMALLEWSNATVEIGTGQYRWATGSRSR